MLLYPTISSYWNSKTQSEAIIDYESMLAQYKPEDYTAIFAEADQYNRALRKLSDPYRDYNLVPDYHSILNVGGTGMIGYITVPKISQELPVYHGTAEGVLSVAVGHVEGSSLPVGGESTHSVVSAHRGLPTAAPLPVSSAAPMTARWSLAVRTTANSSASVTPSTRA